MNSMTQQTPMDLTSNAGSNADLMSVSGRGGLFSSASSVASGVAYPTTSTHKLNLAALGLAEGSEQRELERKHSQNVRAAQQQAKQQAQLNFARQQSVTSK